MIDITHLSSVLFASRPATSSDNTNLIGPGMTRVTVSYGGTGGGPNGKKEDKRHSLTVQEKEIKAPPPPLRAESLADRDTNAQAA